MTWLDYASLGVIAVAAVFGWSFPRAHVRRYPIVDVVDALLLIYGLIASAISIVVISLVFPRVRGVRQPLETLPDFALPTLASAFLAFSAYSGWSMYKRGRGID